jgi:Tfp pilus assembly protein PilN
MKEVFMYYGLDTRKITRLACAAESSFEILPLLDKARCGTRKIVIALPDTQRHGEVVSLSLLTPLLESPALNVVAVELESVAIKRALQHENKAQENCFVIFHHDETRSWWSVFYQQQQLFFHEEKVDDIEIAKKRFSKLFEKNYPELTIEQYYEDTEWLLSTGLSLWDEKTCQNLLPCASVNKGERKLVKYFFKAFLYGILAVCLIYSILLLLMHFQDEKISAFEARLPQIQAAETLGEKIQALQSSASLLNALSVKQRVPSSFLETLSTTIPEGVFLDALTLKKNQATMTGHAETKAQAEMLLKNIKNQKRFKQAAFTELTQDDANLPYHFHFTLTLETQ